MSDRKIIIRLGNVEHHMTREEFDRGVGAQLREQRLYIVGESEMKEIAVGEVRKALAKHGLFIVDKADRLLLDACDTVEDQDTYLTSDGRETFGNEWAEHRVVKKLVERRAAKKGSA